MRFAQFFQPTRALPAVLAASLMAVAMPAAIADDDVDADASECDRSVRERLRDHHVRHVITREDLERTGRVDLAGAIRTAPRRPVTSTLGQKTCAETDAAD